MPELTYYLFNLVVLLPVLLLSIFSDVQPHKQWRTLLKCTLFVSLPFIYWDIWAANEGHWGFSETYITSSRILGLPVEEILFFFTVPFACLFVWGAVQKHYRTKKRVPFAMQKVIAVMFLAPTVILLFVNFGLGYTRSALLAFLLTIILYSIYGRALTAKRQFWLFNSIVLALFLVFNSFLTALPVITYGAESFTGFRIGTIPVEDFFFNFALINLTLLVWEKSLPLQKGRTTKGAQKSSKRFL
jgi:lycopene cyclase domain-containing protein